MKKELIKTIGVVLALTIGISLFTACGSNENTPTESTSGQIEIVE